jgi:hypothetical protein
VITEFLIWVMASTARLLFAVIPGPDPTAAQTASGVQQGLGTVLAYCTQFGAWIPWNVVGPAVLITFAALIASGGIKLVRIVLSFITLGGGSAA